MASDATAALALARFAGAPLDVLHGRLRRLPGAGRALEVLGEAGGVTVVDIRPSPAEAWAAINAARARYGRARIVAIHAPRAYSRTLALLEDYRRSFDEADIVVLGPIEAAREAPPGGDECRPPTSPPGSRVARSTSVSSSAEGVELVTGSLELGISWWCSRWEASTRSPRASSPHWQSAPGLRRLLRILVTPA